VGYSGTYLSKRKKNVDYHEFTKKKNLSFKNKYVEIEKDK